MKTNSSHCFHLLASVFMLFLCASLSWAQTVRYVKSNATGANNGTSWNDAYVSLQSALAAAQPNDQIWVAAGTYKPTIGTDRTISFSMKNDVAIYGGFPNVGSPSMADRNWQTNVTILSGDLNGDDQVEGSGTLLRINNAGENSYQVVANRFTEQTPLLPTAVLDGFTVTGGTNQESLFGPYNSGAGMFNLYASPTVRNTRFYGNSGYTGGGMTNSLNCSPVVTNVVFDRNLAFANGGGMYNFNGANVVLTNVVFTGNLGYGSFGGGATFNGYNNPSFTNCHFEGNGASVGAGVVGIGMMANFNNCTAVNNRSFQDGGFAWIEDSSVGFTNCIFSGNRAGTFAGVIRNRNSTLNIVNCTFFDNRSGVNSGQGSLVASSGVMAIDGANPITNIANSIIWGNQTLFGGSSNPAISYSIVQGGWNGTGNSGNDPLFFNSSMPAGADNVFRTSDDGLALQRCSPAINAGSNGLITSGITTDLLQNTRRFNNGTVDLGPYEFQTESFNTEVSSNSPVCIGTSLELNVTGGNTYTWAGPNNFNSTEQRPILPGVEANTSGGYSVTVADGTCTVTTSTFVQVNNPTVEATSVSPACSGGVLSLSASSGGLGYTWSGPNGYSSVLQNPTRSDVSPTMSGLYSVTLSDGKCSATATTSVQVYASPSVVVSNNGVVCSGNPLNLSATGNGNAYTWSGPNGFSSLSQSPVRTPSSVDMSGGYTVTASNGTCTTTASTLVEVRSLPTLEVSSNSPLCAGSALNLSASGSGNAYSWSGPNNFNSTEQSPIRSSANTSMSGLYSVTISDGTCISTELTYVLVNTPIIQLTNNSPVCLGNTLNLSASGSGVAYTWSGPNGYSSILPNPSRSSANLSMSGQYIVTVSDGTCTATASILVQINNNPDVTAGHYTPVCSGSTLSLTASGGGSSYTWSGPNGFSSLSQNPVRNTSSIDMSGGYTVTLSDGTCTATASTSVEVVASPTATVTSNSPLCVGSTLFLNVTASSNNYSWTGPNGFTSGQSSPIRPDVNTSMSGKYSVMVSDGTCTITVSTLVVVSNPTANLSSNSPVCAGSALNLSATGGSAYTWAGPGGYSSTSQNPRLASASPSMSGTYSITVRNLGGCTATGTVSVVVSPNVAPSITSLRVNGNLPNAQTNTATACTNTPVNLNITATNAVTYSWRGPTGAGSGFTSSLVSPVTMPIASPRQGQYTVTVRNGCQVFNQRVINLQLINCSNTRLASAEDTEAIEMEINAYPNPVSKTLKVEVRLKEPAALQLRLLNSIGQENGTWQLGEVRDFHQTELNLADLRGGVYLLEAQAGKLKVVKRVVKIQ